MAMEQFYGTQSASLLTEVQGFINNNEGLWGFLALLVLILGIVFAWITGLFRIIINSISRIVRKMNKKLTPNLPTETLRFVPQPHQSLWGYGSKKVGRKKVKIIQASCSLYATNITSGDILITSSYMKRPKRSEDAIPMIQEAPPRARYWGRYPVLAGLTSEVKVNYFIDGNLCKKGRELKADIVLIDQLGNEHVVRNVVFRPIK